MKEEKNTQENYKRIEEIKPRNVGEKLLLHACCGPCTIEPFRILKNAGWEIIIYYSNDNIYPESEYYKRYDNLYEWCCSNKIKVVLDDYKPEKWLENIKGYPFSEQKTKKRELRCSHCYAHRLKYTAEYANNNNITYLASTLAVSPWQYNDALKNELSIICKKYNLKPVFMDFRPYYKNAVKESKNLNMYRQKYCGCALSLNESIEQFKRSNNKKYLNEVLSIK